MTWIQSIALFLLMFVPATNPATAPSDSPPREGEVMLDHGQVRFVAPAGWTIQHRADNDLSIQYKSADGKSFMALVVVHQKEPLPDSAGKAIGASLIRKLQADTKAAGATFVSEPRVEKDDRFLLKLLDVTKKGTQTNYRLHAYRQIGSTLMSVVCQAYTEKADRATAMQKQAEDLLASAVAGEAVEKPTASSPATSAMHTAGDAPGPTFLLKSHLRIDSPPAGWRSQKSDGAGGVIVSYHELGGENGLIIVSIRALPDEAKHSPTLRDALIDEILSGEKDAIQIPGAKEKDKPHTVIDSRFIRKTLQKYDVKGEGYQVVSRQVAVGNSLLSIASLAPDERADAIDKLADAVATSIRPIAK